MYTFKDTILWHNFNGQCFGSVPSHKTYPISMLNINWYFDLVILKNYLIFKNKNKKLI